MNQNQYYNLIEFLQETRYCDCNHPAIKNLSYELTKDCSSDVEKAIVLFEYVRDNILYEFGEWGRKASIILEKGSGMCTNSANLLVALFRAVGIPSGYGIMKTNAKEYFGPIMLPIFKNLVSDKSVHIYAYAYLDNKWVKCDPSTDKQLSEKTSYFNPTTELVVWDGLSDKIDNLDPKYIYSDSGPFANIDDKLDKKPKNASRNVLMVGNLYLDFLRKSDVKISNPSQLQPMFLSWLKKNYPFRYVVILSIIKFKSLGKRKTA